MEELFKKSLKNYIDASKNLFNSFCFAISKMELAVIISSNIILELIILD